MKMFFAIVLISIVASVNSLPGPAEQNRIGGIVGVSPRWKFCISFSKDFGINPLWTFCISNGKSYEELEQLIDTLKTDVEAEYSIQPDDEQIEDRKLCISNNLFIEPKNVEISPRWKFCI